MAKAKDEKIPNMGTSWEGYAGKRVEEFIKEQLGERYGWLATSEDTDEKNFFHLYAFDSKASFDEWEAQGKDPSSPLIKQDMEIPISTAKEGKTYVATLRSTISSTANIIVVEDSLEVELNYRSIVVDAALSQQLNANIKGIIEVQRKTTGNWEVVGKLEEELDSKDNYDDYVTVNVGKYLTQGRQELRLQAYYYYTSEETGEQKMVRSSVVLVGGSVTRTTLRLDLNTDYHIPMEAFEKEEDGGGRKDFKVEYSMVGDCEKTLHVVVEGSIKDGEEYKKKEIVTDKSVIVLPEESAYGFLEHGVRKVTAWITAPNGLGDTLRSNTLVNSFMVVNKTSENYDATKKYLLIQNRAETITNFIQSTLMDYAVYSENSEKTELNFSIQSAQGELYTEIITVAESNRPYNLTTTIEIEAKDEASIPAEYVTRLYVFRDGDNNFVEESEIHSSKFFGLVVDNSEAIMPISGSTFLVNPKNRSNDIDPFKIFNAAKGNIEVDATFENFGLVNDLWTTDEYGRKCLRVFAGQKIVIKRNIWESFMKNPNSSLTLDIDFRARNVTNTEDPIISISGGGNKGLILNALTGWVRTKSYNNSDNSMFAWREGQRQFLTMNVCNEVKPKKVGVNDVIFQADDAVKAEGSLALARILLNGDPVREIPFNIEDNGEWCDDANASIVIGNAGADVDIYSIRAYEGVRISNWIDLLNKNYLSSLPTTEEKLAMKRKNDLYDVNENRITLQKALDAKLNCIVYHGQRPYVYDKSEDHAGYIEYYRFDLHGNALPEYSGTNCIGTKSLKWKAQGSTAKTYYEHNMQDDNSKVKKYIDVLVSDFHESISVSEPYEGEIKDGDKVVYSGLIVDITGGNLGKNFPLEDQTQPYEYHDGYVKVLDGWIDGNGKYRGMGYMVAEGTALAQKKVSKINYASAMQSHLLAACKSYDELHYEVVGATPMQKQATDAGHVRPVSAKHTEPFLMFWEQGDGVAYYTGLCVYGAGKMDKVSWGYTKKKHKMFSLIEGSDNNLPMTDFRVPFDKNTAVYDCGEEYWAYLTKDSAGVEQLDGSLDFDGGMTVGYKSEKAGDDSIEAQMADGWQFRFSKIDAEKIEEEAEAPSSQVRDQWALKHNFIYLNSTNIAHFDGTVADFKSPNTPKDTSYKYWCTSYTKNNKGEYYVPLLRYDFYNREWVHAGLWDDVSKSYKEVNLATDNRTKATFEKYRTTADYEKMTEGFKTDMAAFMRTYGSLFINIASLTFNYGYVLSLLAGTDNSSKNTYFKTDPIAQDMSDKQTDEFDRWFDDNFGGTFNYKEVYQLYFDGDDMDSILPVNNKGNMTKPYYIERKYPYREGDSESLYEGMANQLFNFVEYAYTEVERSNVMYNIFKAMNTLMRSDDIILGSATNKVSIWGFLHKYFFNVQYYFPQIAYIEQARIRYEFAHLVGNPGAARGVTPISQSIGSQVENEQQFMEQRVVYMASFAGYGALGNVPSGGAIGIADAEVQLSFQAYGTPTNPQTISLTLQPHQYIYPYGLNGQTIKPTMKRVSPHETCKITLAEDVQKVTDTSLFLNGINYYKSIGNVGDTAIYSTNFSIVGKRMTEFVAEPKGTSSPLKIQKITVEAPLIEKFVIKNCDNFLTENGEPVDVVDLKTLTRCKEIDFYGTKVKEVGIPSSMLLKSVKLGNTIERLSIDDTPNLDTLLFEGVQYLKEISIGDNIGGLKTQALITSLHNAKKNSNSTPIEKMSLESISFSEVSTSMLTWLSNIPSVVITGAMSMAAGEKVGFSLKFNLLNLFGNIDDVNNKLYISYEKKSITDLNLKGLYYHRHPEEYEGVTFPITEQFELVPTVSSENDFIGIEYLVEPYEFPTSTVAMNSKTGELSISNLSTLESKYIVSAVLKKSDGSTIRKSKVIECYNREAKKGDFVYFDGTFSDGSYHNSTVDKAVVGVCFFVAPRDADGNIDSRYFNPSDVQKCLMVGLEDVKRESNIGWVLRPVAGAEQNSSFFTQYVTSSGSTAKESLKVKNNSNSMYDVDPNRGKSLWQHSVSSVSDSRVRSESEENDGFVQYESKYAASVGLMRPDEDISLRTIKTDDLGKGKEPWMDLAIEAGFSNGDVINEALVLIYKGICIRNDAMTYGLIGQNSNNELFDEETIESLRNLIPKATDAQTEFEVLVSNYSKVSTLVAKFVTSGAHQIIFPGYSAAYAYQPKVANLSNKFKAHRWFLPTAGLWVRILWEALPTAISTTTTGLVAKTNSIFDNAVSKGLMTKFASSQSITDMGHMTSTEIAGNQYYRVYSTSATIPGQYGHWPSRVRPICSF